MTTFDLKDRRTRVLVAPHNFELGGSQINALELVGELAADPRFEMIVYAPDGVLADRVRQLGVELHLTKLREYAPSPRRMMELWALVRARDIDLVHTYEWMPTVDAAMAAAWARGIPMVATILSMDYPYFIPTGLPLVLGTQVLVSRAQNEGRIARLIEPPVDTEQFRPDARQPDEIATIRAECGVADDADLVVVVGRLAQLLKLEGLLTLIETVGSLALKRDLKLAIVGDGPERPRVEAAVRTANVQAGREAVILLGSRLDPLPYYLAADIAVGMGGSALRAMAVGKPLLVQGEQGFWAVADEETLPMFLKQGWYGVSDEAASVDTCRAELSRLLALDDEARADLGRFGRQVVVQRYSLDVAGHALAETYEDVIAQGSPPLRERVTGPVRLMTELFKERLAIRFPGLQRLSRRLRTRLSFTDWASGTGDDDLRVSVVIPCHNYEAYLDDAIDSALTQQGVTVDVTIVDDGSTDGSRAVAENWARRDSRVRVVGHSQNRGHIATFNEALDLATAPYVVKLDADDVLTPGSLRRSADLLSARPDVVFVYGGVEHVRGSMPRAVNSRVRGWKIWSGQDWLMLVARRRARNPISQPEIMIRRAALAEAGGHRPEVPGTSDLHLWLRLASLGNVARIQGAVQGLYRVHDASMRATIHSGLLRDVQARRDAFELFIAERGDQLEDRSGFERAVRRSLSKDAVTNAHLEYESDHDPAPLLAEAVGLDPSIRRTLTWHSLQHQRSRGGRSVWWSKAEHFGRDIAGRIRWRRHRRHGV
ncbi:glycosyltransferase [Microbacterium sp.]|uniref:glycosyltransferase n=1 Tax=Microbacterium sp. TaxID=51671 RepID=UPI003A8E3F4A